LGSEAFILLLALRGVRWQRRKPDLPLSSYQKKREKKAFLMASILRTSDSEHLTSLSDKRPLVISCCRCAIGPIDPHQVERLGAEPLAGVDDSATRWCLLPSEIKTLITGETGLTPLETPLRVLRLNIRDCWLFPNDEFQSG